MHFCDNVCRRAKTEEEVELYGGCKEDGDGIRKGVSVGTRWASHLEMLTLVRVDSATCNPVAATCLFH